MILGVDSTVLKRIIIDLMLKGLSLNQIQEHLQLIYCIRLSHEAIHMIEQEGVTHAKTVAVNLDKRVASKITKLEVDEVFQGQKNVILGVITKGWNYLARLQWSPDRTKVSIAGFLRPIARPYSNITVVITDPFSRYKDLIKTIFQKAVHLVCHIHAERILRKPLSHLRAIFTRRKKTLEHMRMQHHKGLKKVDAIRRRIAFLTARQHKDRKDQQDLEKTLESKTTPRTQTLTRHFDTISNWIKKDHKELSQLQSQQNTLEKMQKDTPQQIVRSHKVLNEAHQDLL